MFFNQPGLPRRSFQQRRTRRATASEAAADRTFERRITTETNEGSEVKIRILRFLRLLGV